jgi:hypothetical protein
MKMQRLEDGVQLSNSPDWTSAIPYAVASGWRTSIITHPIIFQVTLISILPLVIPLVLSPVYRPYHGQYSNTTIIPILGGIGTVVSNSLNLSDFVSQGQVVGRAIISSATDWAPIPSISFDISVAPFIPYYTIQFISKGKVETVVARNSIDCGPSAPSRFTSSQDIVSFGNLSQDYFAAQGAEYYISPTFAGQIVGGITNGPTISVVYLNTTTDIQPGMVQAQSSIIFLAANGTLEGAQQRITSPEPTSRIKFVDVLVCTSNTTLVISNCFIKNGNVTSYSPVDPDRIPGAQSSGVEKYILDPKAVASILATSPVTAYYSFGEHIPAYDTITPEMISAGILPISFMSYNTTADDYHIPMSYIKGVLFGQTAQGLVQGILTDSPANVTRQVFIFSTFGTSKPEVLIIVLVVSVSCALTATFANYRARQAAPMDVRRIMAISRNPQLDTVFGPYSDRKEKMDKDKEILDANVGYTWVESLQRHALVLSHTRASEKDTDVNEDEKV